MSPSSRVTGQTRQPIQFDRAAARPENWLMRPWLFALLGWAGVIFLLSSFPNPPGPRGPEWHSYAAHTVEYATLGFLAAGFVFSLRPQRALVPGLLLAWVLAVLYGISDEVHQSFVPSRHASPIDLAFDAFGAALGCGAFALFIRWRRSRARRRSG